MYYGGPSNFLLIKMLAQAWRSNPGWKHMIEVSLDVRVLLSPPASAKLYWETSLLVLLILYSCFSVSAWAIIYIKNRQPVTSRMHGYDLDTPPFRVGRGEMLTGNCVMRVLLSATTTLVFTINSTTCASTAVVYVQGI